MNRLVNKTALVTGAAGGIGAAIAHLFAEEGASVIATDVQVEKLEQWVTAAREKELALDWMKLDVTQEMEWAEIESKIKKQYGKLDILVNNAGIYPGTLGCEETGLDTWNKIIAINLTGPFLGCKYCISLMRKSGGGSIINVASIAGIVGGNGAAYSASKGGLRLLTKDLAATLAKDNIRANTICPGGVLTPMTEGLMNQPGMGEIIKSMSPQGRMADAMEIAWGALFLAAGESSFATGADLVLDGGAVCR